MTMHAAAAQRSVVQALPALLNASDVATVLSLGAEMAGAKQWKHADRSSSVTFLHSDDRFASQCPKVAEKVQSAAVAAERSLYPQNGARLPLRVRCAELHVYGVGGGLSDVEHYDSGSVITVDVRLSEAGGFGGGSFDTTDADGGVVTHALARAGDGDDGRQRAARQAGEVVRKGVAVID